jgi:hypothetical protein
MRFCSFRCGLRPTQVVQSVELLLEEAPIKPNALFPSIVMFFFFRCQHEANMDLEIAFMGGLCMCAWVCFFSLEGSRSCINFIIFPLYLLFSRRDGGSIFSIIFFSLLFICVP